MECTLVVMLVDLVLGVILKYVKENCSSQPILICDTITFTCEEGSVIQYVCQIYDCTVEGNTSNVARNKELISLCVVRVISANFKSGVMLDCFSL